MSLILHQKYKLPDYRLTDAEWHHRHRLPDTVRRNDMISSRDISEGRTTIVRASSSLRKVSLSSSLTLDLHTTSHGRNKHINLSRRSFQTHKSPATAAPRRWQMRAARGDAGDGADGCGGAAESRGHRRRFYSSQPELSDKFVRAKELRLLSKHFPQTLPPAMASGGEERRERHLSLLSMRWERH